MWEEIMEFAARPVHGISDAFKPATAVAAGVSVIGAISEAPIVAWSAALVAGGTVVIPRAIDWYRSIRAAQREQHAADIALDAKILAEEVRKRVELEGKCERLEAESTRLKAEIATERHRGNGQDQTILVLKAELDALRRGQAKLNTKVRAMTPDPDAPEHGTDEFSSLPPKATP